MDKYAAAENRGGRRFGGRRGDGGSVVLLDAKVFAGWLPAYSTCEFPSFRPCRTDGYGLPLLPQHGGKVMVCQPACGQRLHELPQLGAEG